MQRRIVLKNLLAAAIPLSVSTLSTAADAPEPAKAALSGRWSAANARRIEAVLQQYGNTGAGYSPARQPYVVFDWDNTSIMNDCEEALFMYQIEHLAFQLDPDAFARVLRDEIPDGPFKVEAGYVTRDGQPVLMHNLAADISADYRILYALKADPSHSVSDNLARMQASLEFQDFRAKLYFMYEAICDTYPLEIGYKWIIKFFTGMTPPQLQALALEAISHGLGDALRKVKYQSPPDLPGQAGIVSTSFFHGLRINDDIVSLMHTLRSNGIEVFVSTASLDDVVRVFAGHPHFGYGVAPDNVIGLRLEMLDGRYTSAYRKNWHFNWGPGKTVGIRSVLGARGAPLMVFGDSDGDAWMLSDFPQTQVGVIINRLKTGPIGKLSQQAAASIAQPAARFLLQGRDETTGLTLPDERSLKYGQSTLKLVA